MQVTPVEIKPFKSIKYGLSLLEKVGLLDVVIDSSKNFESDTQYDTLLNWLLLSKFLKTVYLKHDGLTLYNVKVRTVGKFEGGFTFSISNSLNDLKIHSNIEWDYRDGRKYKLEEIELSETLRGLANWSKDIFWAEKVRQFVFYTGGEDWYKVYAQVRRIAEDDEFSLWG